MERTARCSCGQLAVVIEGDPTFHGLCSCLDCQRASGSAFTYSGYWPKSAVRRISGPSTRWRNIVDSGRWIDTHFCPSCGSAVYWYAEFAPDMINVAVGNFADPTFPPPTYAVYNKRKHPWVQVPSGCASYETGAGRDATGEPARSSTEGS